MTKGVVAAALLLGLSGVTGSITGNPTLLGQQVVGSPIRHVIVLVQENRSFDNVFASSILARGGPYPGADTSQATTIDGKPVSLKPVPFEYPADPSHNHLALLKEWNGGKMNGFADDAVRSVLGFVKPAPGFTYAYLPDSETTIYHVLASRYALADENFATRLIPTFPSHFALATAQSRIAGNPNDSIWGCDSKPGTTVPLFGAGEAMIVPGVFPCFDQISIADLLDAGHVTWKYYTGAYDNVSDPTVNIYDAFRKVRYGPDWQRNVITPSGTILGDIAHCRLPQVSFVMPNWLDSDHAGNLSAGGPGWVGSIYLAIVQSQHAAPECNYYKDSAVILTWDDSGGWYDHVAPPAGPGGTSWGFRIPIVVMSAWARSNYNPQRPGATPYVSHTRRESTAITTFIEKNWALGNMGQRDATDDDLADMFDYTRAAPVPAFSQVSMKRMIRRTRFNLAVAERNDHVVDDDR
ncbi:MAG TPA: alkaline phosphatase family protein [Candidatus Dormibacteraeota bacterium]|nr:alkaline phosphatase family protein [Candidatus Dormibacteraeota bacterium]